MTRRPLTFAAAALAGVALVLPVELPAQAATPTALSVAQRLTVKGRAPKTGYDRAKFGTAWTDNNPAPWGHNGCSTREDILRRDLSQLRFKKSGRCTRVVTTGRLTDPYTGKVINFVRGQGTSSKVQIDHVVPLADAWQKGAQQWSTATRLAFANDPLNLLAVDGPTNQKKGAGDAATWLPPNKPPRRSRPWSESCRAARGSSYRPSLVAANRAKPGSSAASRRHCARPVRSVPTTPMLPSPPDR